MNQDKASLSKPLNASLKESFEPISSSSSSSVHQNKNILNPSRTSVNDVLTQSMLTIDYQLHAKLRKKYKICTILSIACIIIGVILLAAMPAIIRSVIKSTAIDTVIFTKQNQGLWAHFPGDSQTYITRNYTFFNFTNPQQVILHGQKPKFRQISGYIIGQFQDYLNITYSLDGSTVSVRDWMYFDYREQSRSLQQKVNILNIGKLGYWYQLKQAQAPKLLQQGLATIFSTLEDAILINAYSQGIWAQFLNESAKAQTLIYNPAGITDNANHQFLWKDTIYGMHDMNNLRYWIQAAQPFLQGGNQKFTMDALNLKDYFTLSNEQMRIILLKFADLITAVSYTIQNNYCPNILAQNCTGRYLTIEQMRRSWVTKNPPSPIQNIIKPSDSICFSNITCKGLFPEIGAYYQNVYLVQNPGKDRNITFDFYMVQRWFDYNNTKDNIIPGLNYTTAQDCLLHIGNLQFLWQNGNLYDQTGQLQYIYKISKRFGLKGKADTQVFWQWLKYFYLKVIKQLGTNEHVGISTLFVQGLYDSYSTLQDKLQIFLLTQIINNNLKDTTCLNMIKASLQTQKDDKANEICTKFASSKQQLIQKLIKTCRNKDQQEYNKLLKDFDLSFIQLQSICDKNINNGFGQYYHSGRVFLNSFYQCYQTPNYYCSDFQIAAKQWANSTITRKLIPSLSNKYKQSYTISQWFPSQFTAFQYGYLISKTHQMMPLFNIKQVFQSMNFQNWFSSFVIQKIFMSKDTLQAYKQYIRYATIFVSMKGFTMQAKVWNLMFGYKDQFLESIRTAYPPFGGDPSVMSTFMFNDPNITKEQTYLDLQIATGKGDYKQIGIFKKIYGLDYMTVNKTTFNGNQTKWELVTPWKVIDKMVGTNGKFFGPDQQIGSQQYKIYIPNIQRYGTGNNTYDAQRYGLPLRKGYLPDYIYKNSEIYPDNDKYYQNFFAVFNETSVVGGVPFFITKNHFQNCTSNWTQLVDIYNQDQSILYKETSQWDQSFILVEPHSGVSFQSTIYLQTNFYYEPDQLFTYNKTTLLPTFTVYRSGNITQGAVNKYFGDLKTGLSAITVFKVVGIIIIVIFLGLAGFAIFNLHKINKGLIKQEGSFDDKKDGNINISLQKRDQDNEDLKQKKKMVKVQDEDSQQQENKE